jgi:diaminopimelate decarboxylase
VDRLIPRIHPLVRSLLSRARLTEVVTRYGTPLHVVFPQVFAENVETFRRTLAGYPLRSRLFYAHKANQSRALAVAALTSSIGIDVASAGELGHALACGFTPDRIEATGPKGRAFIHELVDAGVTINVDNPWELGQIAEYGKPSRVLLRVCPPVRLSSRRGGRTSRFGTPTTDIPAMLDVIQGNENLDLRGFAFHLDTNDVREKVLAIDACLELFDVAHSRGLSPGVLNIGGGFRQVFIADPERFDRYVDALKASMTGPADSLSWDGNTFGYHRQDGRMHGTPTFHKYANTTPGTDVLAEILDSPLPSQGGRSVAHVLLENMIELWLEPGKALVDQAGITITGVEFTKQAADGSTLVNLDISRDKICPADQEVMLDPVVVHVNDPPGGAVGVYFAGNLCLERDMVTNHRTWLEHLPLPGDLVVFVNTAAYQMDLSASDALMQPRAKKVAVLARGDDFSVLTD